MKMKRNIAGLSILLLGVLFLFVDLEIFTGFWTLLLCSIILCAFYFINGGPSNMNNMWIILSALLLFMSWLLFLIQSFDILIHNGFFLIFTGFAFLISFFIHRAPPYPQPFWMLLVGGLLLLVGLFWILAFAIWPLLFIGFGLFIIVSARK